MRRRSPRLLLLLILALVIVPGVLLTRWNPPDQAARQPADSMPGEISGKVPEGFGPIPTVGAPDHTHRPAIPPRGDVVRGSSEAMRNLAARMSRETGGLQVVTHPDGRRSVALGGRFLHMSAAVAGADGKTEVRCFTDYHEMVAALPGNPPSGPSHPVPHAR